MEYKHDNHLKECHKLQTKWWRVTHFLCTLLWLDSSVKWKWTMLRDRILFYGQSKIVGSLGPHHDDMIFLGANVKLIACPCSLVLH